MTHPGVDKIAFTGSPPPGARSPRSAGEDLRRVTLELGGKSAAIVLDDADLGPRSATRPPTLMNNGQACIAQTRILAPSALRRGRRALAAGRRPQGRRPLDPATRSARWSPTASATGSQGYIEIGKRGRPRRHRRRPPGRPGRGWYVEPTVFADVDNSMRIAQEEIFGPVLVGDPLRGRGRRGAHRQRLRLRPVRRGLRRGRRARPRHGPPASAPAPSRSTAADRLRRPVRRLQAVRPGPRVRPGGPEGLPRVQDDQAANAGPAVGA